MNCLSRSRLLSGAAIIAALLAAWSASVSQADDKAPQKQTVAKGDEAVERTRGKVRMLDDVLKTAIVVVTDTYVKDETDIAAAVSFKTLFGAMKTKNYADVRLIDATGEPYEEDNAPKDDFEKKAVAALVKGAPYYDEVIQKDGKRYLRAATAVPVVMEKCTLCHDHWKDVPKGKAIGAIGYIVPIE